MPTLLKFHNREQKVYGYGIIIVGFIIILLVGIESAIIGLPWGATFFFAHLFFLFLELALAIFFVQSEINESKREPEKKVE